MKVDIQPDRVSLRWCSWIPCAG